MKEGIYHTNKLCAMHWMNGDFVLCNKIGEIDPELLDCTKQSTLQCEDPVDPDECPECGSVDISPIYDDDEITDEWVCNKCGHEWCPDDEEEEDDDDYAYPEIFQYYLTSYSEDDVDFLCKHFTGMYFAYSNVLDCWVFLATDFGTHRGWVSEYTDLPAAERELGVSKQGERY